MAAKSFIISISIFRLAVTSGLAVASEGGVEEGLTSDLSPGVDPGVGLPKKVSILDLPVRLDMPVAGQSDQSISGLALEKEA